MSRWAVRQNLIRDGWGVYRVSPDGVSGVLWERVTPWFDTWREAMDHADRCSRTREVVLPRSYALPTGRHTMHRNGLVIEFKQSSSWPQLNPSYVVVEPEERRPLALALLALAEREGA